MRDVTDPLLNLVRRRREPIVAQTGRSTVATVIAYAVARQLSSAPAPLTAPLAALLVTQVTLYTTLKTGMRRVNAVVAGVLIATGFSSLVGLTWWSLGIVIRRPGHRPVCQGRGGLSGDRDQRHAGPRRDAGRRHGLGPGAGNLSAPS